MARNFPDWLTAFMKYASYSEAPPHMHFWAGVSAVAGALRRKVWIDQAYFNWYPNFYIVLVAPPGIVAKSTTSGIAMNLLREVPGIHFGPDVLTWQSLVTDFASKTEGFEFLGEMHPMSALTFESSEFGNLLDPSDKAMVDLLVSLWDGKQGGFTKATKSSGSDLIENPWINLIACTTPSWIAGNFPEYMIGGGFTSRCLFVYAEKKAKLVAYPGLTIPGDIKQMAARLVEDLGHISTALMGPYTLTSEAITWGEAWYKDHYATKHLHLDDGRFGGYLARKQTHIHKLAMILAASSSNEMILTAEHLAVANQMVTDLEPDMHFVFSKIGKSDDSIYAEKLIDFVQKRDVVPYLEAYRFVHSYFPSMRNFEDILAGCIRAGYLTFDTMAKTLARGPSELPKSGDGMKRK